MKKALAWVWVALAVWLAGCARAEARIEMVFFAAGKADAILIQTQGSAVLVDAGLDKDAEALVEKLKKRGVARLDALIVTHFDKDHVGGADVVLERMAVGAVYQPGYAKDSKQYRQYTAALAAAGVTPFTLVENHSFRLDGADYAIDVANESDYGEDEENDFSLVVKVTCGQATALLAGDAEAARLGELLEEGGLDSQLVKVPHHGRYNANTAAFLEAVNPQLAVITSSDEQMEDPETLATLQALGAQVLLTRQGDVVCRSDGTSWTVH